MGIFQVIRSAVYDPAFYTGLRERTWTEGAKYYAVVSFVVVFAFVAPIWALLLTVSPQTIDTVAAVYPESLVITVANGVMSTNQEEPYFIPNTFYPELGKNLAVFDTKSDQFSNEEFTSYETVALFKQKFAVGANSANYRDGQMQRGDIRVYDYGTSTATSTLAKADVLAFAEKVKPYVRPVTIAGGAILFSLVVFFGGLGMLVFHLIYILIAAALVFVYFKMRSKDESYRSAYTVALFASIPVTILSAAFDLLGPGLPPLVYTLLLMILVIVNDSQVPKPEVVPTHV